jgi:hypothetical protein
MSREREPGQWTDNDGPVEPMGDPNSEENRRKDQENQDRIDQVSRDWSLGATD